MALDAPSGYGNSPHMLVAVAILPGTGLLTALR
jgi:hypothetical protein